MASDISKEKFPLSVVVLARNESINIERCVKAVRWCDDVVVVDDRSTDGTVDIALACGVRVVQHPFDSFADQRNWAMLHASLRHSWVLHLDADEVVTDELRKELENRLLIAGEGVVAFRMCRKVIFQGRWLKYSDGFPVWIMRLVRKDKVRFEASGHGEVAVPDVAGEMPTISEPFLHFCFSKGIADWIDRHNRYSTREAVLEVEQLTPVRFAGLFSTNASSRRATARSISRRLPFRPWLRFFYQYILKRGFLDGSPGLVFCRLKASYEEWIILKRNELLERGNKSNSSNSSNPV